MKISAQIWAFVVMMVALGIGIYYVDSIDVDTEVKTAEETRLPQVFPAEGQDNPTGLTFRYPRGWQVANDNVTFNFSTRADDEEVNLSMTLVQLANAGEVNLEEQLTALLQGSGIEPDPADIEEVDHALGAVQYQVENAADNTVSILEMGRLTQDNILYQLNSSPIPQGSVDEVLEDLDAVFEKMNAESVVIPQPMFTYTLPEGWQLAGENEVSFQAVVSDPANPQQGAVVLVRLDPAEDTLQLLKGFVTDAVDASATLDDITTSEALLNFIADSEGVENASEVEDASYFGLEGKKVTFTTPSDGGIQEMAVMTDDTDSILVYTRYSSEEIKTALESQMQDFLNSVQYTPAP